MTIELPPLWTLKELQEAQLGRAVVWAAPSVAARVGAVLRLAPTDPVAALADDLETLIVVGGGMLIDRAKWAAKERARPLRLVAAPSIWGSGAEASKVVVLDELGRKQIHVDAKYVPDVRVFWPELAQTLDAGQVRHACGDCWSHALEGFCSPLASDALRAQLAALMRQMLAVELINDPRWFALSAAACAGQALSGVGLIHGIAHTLEHPLRTAQPHEGWGHARLCATFLWPVHRFNRAHSDQWSSLALRHEVEERRIEAVARELFDASAYTSALPVLAEHWRAVLRDPCTRSNSVLVRPGALEFFQREAMT